MHTSTSSPLLQLHEFRVQTSQDVPPQTAWQSPELTLTLSPGQLIALVGPWGSGKSVLLEALAEMRRPGLETQGQVEHAGGPLSFIPQDPRLAALPQDRISDLLRSALGTNDWRARAHTRLEQLRLPAERILSLRFHQLSASEQHLTLVAYATLRPHRTLLYDGWAESLSAQQITALRSLLQTLLQEGVGVLVSSRSSEQLAQLAPTLYSLAPTVAEPPVVVPLTERMEPPSSSERSSKTVLEVQRLLLTPPRHQLFSLFRRTPPPPIASLRSFRLHTGELALLEGAPGTGKTRFLEAIAGLRPATEGRILFRGRSLAPLQSERSKSLRRELPLLSRLAFTQLDGKLTVREHLQNAQQNAAAPSLTPEQWLERVGLPERLLELPSDFLSAAEAQRVALACCLQAQPSLVLWDAPEAAGLTQEDVHLRALIQSQQKQGTSFLLTSSEATRLSFLRAQRFRLETESDAPPSHAQREAPPPPAD